jgi:hypothetical protein
MQLQDFDAYPVLSALTESSGILRKERGKIKGEKRQGVKEGRYESQN